MINPESPLIQGFANVDDQYTNFAIPAYGAGPITNINRMRALQFSNQMIPMLGAPFGGQTQFQIPLNAGFGNPSFFGGSQPQNGIFRGFVAVPMFAHLPSPYMGNPNTPNYGPPSYQYEGSRDRYFEQPFDQENRPDDSFEPPRDDNIYEPRADDPDDISLDYRPRVYDTQSRDIRVNQQYPSFASDDTGMGRQFAYPQEEPSFTDMSMDKRSFPTRPQSDSEYGKPYVFTKDHVGFGPITVEAKTANAKDEDPKDDE